MLIAIDPGHGGKDPGAVGAHLLEKDINLNISLKLREILVQRNIDVIMTRDKDVMLELQPRCDIANNSKADYFISIHANSFKDSDAKGTETYAFSKNSIGNKLADHVQKAIVSTLNTVDRGVKFANFYVLRYTDMPAILIETAFITNKDDENLLITKPDLFALAISNGIMNFLSITDANWAQQDLIKLKELGIIVDYHDPEVCVKWGELAAVINRVLEVFKK
ncbi:MAG: N-acetylmuramoyl-L-alanine amidase [Thermoanaerobacteraceae bacterium]|nr:N-acetylmuramoyl-L-alanine amidase [Thermoanaerobacteraceae bacterium]